MREPQPPQPYKATSGQGHKKRDDALVGAPLVLITASHQQLHTPIDTIPHIAPPDASDVKKGKNTLPQPEPDTPHSPTCTNRKDPVIKDKRITMHAKLQKRLPTSTKLKSTSPRETSYSSERQHHAKQPPAPLGDRVPRSRKRQQSSGEPLLTPHPHTIARLTELLDTCTDTQYIDIIKSLPADWSATNERGITVTKRQLEMAQWEAYKEDHIVLTFQQTTMLTR